MGQTVLKIALAGLLHDVGKFAQGNIDISRQYANDNADQYQPFKNNRHTHIHALYTAAFIEHFADRLPRQFNQPGWGEGDSFVNLAAGHHKPETALQWLIAQADRISSGLDRASFEQGETIAFRDFKRTRLLPLFEGLGADKIQHYQKRGDYRYRYPLAPLSAGIIFPLKQDEKNIKEEPEKEYRLLFETFTERLARLQNREDDIELWASHFDSLFLTCTALLPAARVGDVIHDVSLYDHCRTTAAFASALYSYHKDHSSLDVAAISDNTPQKFLLVTGDFYGIQDFIFSTGGEIKKFRSKILRGRSFAVSLFSELAADMLCRSLGLSFLSIVFNAAGKFTLIAPNTAKSRQAILDTEEELNEWLFQISCGQAALGIATTPSSPSEYYSGQYVNLYDRHLRDVQKRKLEKIKLEKYSGVMKSYLSSFDHGLCALCGKRAATVEAINDKHILGSDKVTSCSVCRDHVMLGTWLVKSKRLMITASREPSNSPRELLQPLFARYQLCFLNDNHQPQRQPLKVWQVSANEDGSMLSDITIRPLNGYIPLYRKEEALEGLREGEPKTFNHIALGAKTAVEGGGEKGTEALGILKADVDNLGSLMGCGLSEARFTISRLATLSRQLDAFFSLYLPNLLAGRQEYSDVYTVFAGGDDLFLIGPWNTVASLADHLNKRFEEYVCANSGITFSAGISVQKPHTPVDKLALAAESALEQSKAVNDKNSVTMFGQTVPWQSFRALLQNRLEMQSWLEKKYISSGMMYRFNQFISLSGRLKLAMAQDKVNLEDLDALKWRAMFSYSTQRNINPALKGDQRQRAVDEINLMAKWIEEYGTALRIPLWHLLYNRR
jgi:CRISPR-associated protein Csm1